MTVAINSSVRTTVVSGTGVTLTAPPISYLTSDDVFDARDTNNTVTDALNGFVTGAGVDLTDLAVSASTLNGFFTATITATPTQINKLTGLTAATNDLNVLTGVYGSVQSSDLVKLGSVSATAAQLSALAGWNGTSSDLNKLHGMSTSQADLDAISGLAGVSVSTTQLAYLSGLSQNVNAFISVQPNLSGMTSSIGDLNLLTGAAAGSGSYTSSAVTATNLSYLHGVTSNIQTQLNAKLASAGTINLSQISGIVTSLTEINYVSGVTSAIQTQLGTLSSGKLALAGGTMTGVLALANGAANAPSLSFANSTGSGLYRVTGDTIGIAIAGSQYGQIAAAGVQFGMGTAGAPFMTTTSIGVGAPAYSFASDTTTGMYRSGTTALGLAANGVNYFTVDGSATNTVTIGGASATNAVVTISGVFQGAKMVGNASVNMKSTGNTVLYTVPTGRRLIVTSVEFIAMSITGSGSVPQVKLGYTGSFNQILDGVTNSTMLSALTTTGQIIPISGSAFTTLSGSSGTLYGFLAAGSALTLVVGTAATYTAYTVQVIVQGIEF